MSGYFKIEDKFVDQYLTKDEESVEEAKVRLHKEQKERKELHAERKKHHNKKCHSM